MTKETQQDTELITGTQLSSLVLHLLLYASLNPYFLLFLAPIGTNYLVPTNCSKVDTEVGIGQLVIQAAGTGTRPSSKARA